MEEEEEDNATRNAVLLQQFQIAIFLDNWKAYDILSTKCLLSKRDSIGVIGNMGRREIIYSVVHERYPGQCDQSFTKMKDLPSLQLTPLFGVVSRTYV